VHIARLVLTHKEAPYTFEDLEPDMGSPKHLALHPFDRVPILRHGDFMLYETSPLSKSCFRRPPAAGYATRSGTDEPVDQRSKFLLLPVHDLSRLT
jgi:hypothetical protein